VVLFAIGSLLWPALAGAQGAAPRPPAPIGTPSDASAEPASDSDAGSLVPWQGDLTESARQALGRYLTDEQDQSKVADLRALLKKRIGLIEAHGVPGDVEQTDALILVLMSTLEREKRDKTMQALNEIWDTPEDYYQALLDVYANLHRYRTWLGPGRYDTLQAQRTFYAQYRDPFLQWRDSQAARPGRFGRYLVAPPAYTQSRATAAQPVQLPFSIASGQQTYYGDQPSFPRRPVRTTGLPGRPYWPKLRKDAGNSGKRIIAPSTRVNPGTSTVRTPFNP
jgi:hypothetical protein